MPIFDEEISERIENMISSITEYNCSCRDFQIGDYGYYLVFISVNGELPFEFLISEVETPNQLINEVIEKVSPYILDDAIFDEVSINYTDMIELRAYSDSLTEDQIKEIRKTLYTGSFVQDVIDKVISK